MLISHEHKFIFIKPKKVAGSSVIYALGQHCPEKASSISSYQEFRTKTIYRPGGEDVANRTEFHGVKANGHVDARRIHRLVGDKIWNSYTKVSVVRNPWDCVVSLFWYYGGKQRRAEQFPRFLHNTQAACRPFNRKHYFHASKMILDFVIRFETLQEDYNSFCTLIGLPNTILPRLNTKSRRDKRHYSTYYNDERRELIARCWDLEIAHFGHEFEQKAQ